MPKHRNKELDFIKGFLIFLVVFGHTIQYILFSGDIKFFEDKIFILIYMFHMPLFIAISGYFAVPEKISKEPISRVIRKRADQILKPMIFWVILTVLCKVALEIAYGKIDVITLIQFSVKNFSGSYWFLWSVFFSYVFLRFIVVIRVRLILSTLFICFILIAIPFYRLPFGGNSLYMFSYMFPFFCGGIAVRYLRNGDRLPSPAVTLLPAAFIAACVYLVWSPEAYVYINKVAIGVAPLNVLTTFLGGASVSILATWILLRIYRAAQNTWFAAIVVDLGQITLPLYLAQTLVFRGISQIPLPSLSGFPYPLSLCICLVLSLGTVLLLRLLVRNSWQSDSIRALVWGIKSTPTKQQT